MSIARSSHKVRIVAHANEWGACQRGRSSDPVPPSGGHNALHSSGSALGAFLRRKKARLGAPKAITAAAHKLVRIIYSMLRYGQDYVDAGTEYYERHYRQRALRTARRRAAQLGYHLVPISEVQALDVPQRSGLVTAQQYRLVQSPAHPRRLHCE